uniref:Uncharacterized protein n=1 Tax=Anguilla anguilla TaxID=7936 RepID=A0A0E9U4H9_ANGAN
MCECAPFLFMRRTLPNKNKSELNQPQNLCGPEFRASVCYPSKNSTVTVDFVD